MHLHAAVGKLVSRPAQATTVSGSPQPSRLFFVTDRTTGIRFLVDTGAQVSVIRPHPADLYRHSSVELVGANCTTIKTYGERSLTLNLGIRRSLPWVFIIADLPQSIIGIDFLRHFNLMVDPVGHKLIDRLTTCETRGTPADVPSVSPLSYVPISSCGSLRISGVVQTAGYSTSGDYRHCTSYRHARSTDTLSP
ncbi:unnamed protein product [Echinostoma caproni]|uniref:Peptidase A2 domain-containing protein n=1 Tax=Echinostoma caproni TaxID=27848 RepID=A0A183AIZ7_9TREM|nr:unnamed protein product [Echinostoma caproni]